MTALVFAGLAVLTLIACAAGVLVGSVHLTDPTLTQTMIGLRVSRVAVAFLAGAGLAVAGVFVQGLFRNPLASPSILGTTAGATLGGHIALMLSGLVAVGPAAGLVPPEMLLSLGSVLGALGALVVLVAIAGRRRDLVTLLLVGFILSSLFLSLGAFLLSLSQDSWELGRAVVAFALGGVGGSGAGQVALAAPLVLGGIAATWWWHRPLDLMLSGEEEAETLGVDTLAVRRWCVAWTAVLTAGAVAVGANVAFVGLVVPHVMRALVSVEHRKLVPATALAGGCFLVLCDVASRLPSREIPLGVVTGVVGAPVFLSLLLRARGEGRFG